MTHFVWLPPPGIEALDLGATTEVEERPAPTDGDAAVQACPQPAVAASSLSLEEDDGAAGPARPREHAPPKA
eukprot:8596805-Karenia_brevis.AAC.1